MNIVEQFSNWGLSLTRAAASVFPVGFTKPSASSFFVVKVVGANGSGLLERMILLQFIADLIVSHIHAK